LLEVSSDELKQLFVNSLAGFFLGFVELGETDEDLAGGTGVGAVESGEAEGLGLFEKAEDVETTSLQEADVCGVEDIGGNAGSVDDEVAALLAGAALGGLVEGLLDQGHAFGADLGAEVAQTRRRVDVIFELSGGEIAEALGVNVFIDQGDGISIGKVFEVFEHEVGGLSA